MNEPLAPGTALLVRFAAHANKRLGDPGETYFSRQHTTLHVGETLEVVEDSGRGYVLARREGGYVYRVHMTDLMVKPDDQQVTRDAIDLLRTRIERDEARDALRLAEAEVADLKTRLHRMEIANAHNLARADEAEQRLEWIGEALQKEIEG